VKRSIIRGIALGAIAAVSVDPASLLHAQFMEAVTPTPPRKRSDPQCNKTVRPYV